MKKEIEKIEKKEIEKYSTNEVLNHIAEIQDLMKNAMKENEHFGKIPGCGNKLVLLKAGAEKLAFMFRFSTQFEITKTDLQNGHREYEVKTILTHIPSQTIISVGVGSCSSMESKFRYRFVDTAIKPTKDEALKLKLDNKGKWSKKNNEWIWQTKTENDNIADLFNTILKMAKKRSFVDAVITATSCSDIFTQDVEEDLLQDNNDENLHLSASAPSANIDRDYSAEINNISSLDGLKDYYNNLSEQEKLNLMPALKFRKKELTK